MEHFVYHKKGYLNIILACKMPFHQCCPPAMDSALPKPEDHCRVQIMVKSVGQFSTVVFNRIFKQLESKLNRLEVLTSQNVRRLVLLKFISETNPDLARFAEFQAFRKVFGLLCIGQHNGAQLNPSSSSPNLGCLAATSADGHGESPNSMPMANCAGIRRSSLNRLPSVDICDGTDTLEESRQMALLKEQYQKIKRELNDQLVDSRCVLFGFNSHQNSTEVLSFPRSDDLGSLCDQLENVFRELIRSIYVVLDSKRLDSSFERMDTPPYPLLPDEEKYRTGLENVKSKNYRKKCIGRLRKRLADYALLTGFFESALQSYQLAIDLLKATADLLWLAAAYEGWCCAAMLVLAHGPNLCQTQSSNSNNHNNTNVDANSSTSHPRQNHLNSTRRGLEQTAKSGHHRYRSDEASKLLSTSFSLLHDSTEVEPLSASSGETSPQVDAQETVDNNKGTPKNKGKLWQQLLNLDALSSAAQSQPDKHLASISMSSALRSASAHNLALLGQQQQTTASVTGNGPTKKNATGNGVVVSRPEVADRFRQSLENYGRFSFAIHVEYECMMRAVHLPMDSRHYIEVESFLREHTCRFLDDKFTTFNNIMKSKICLDTAQVYNKIGFKRKNAFFLRLAVFFRLFTDTHLENDYKKVYPFLNQSLAGYGIEWRLLSNKNKGTGKSLKARFLADIGSANTFSLQTKAVHEVFTVANRAGLHDIGTRHLCFMLEAFFDHLDKAASLVLVEDLKNRQSGETLHDLERAITLDSTPAVVLPPMQFTKFPILKNFAILPLPAHLAPKVIDRLSFQANVFIYSPFQDRLSNKKEIHWVLNCGTEVFVRAENPLPVELAVDNLMLLTEGCDFVAVPVRLQLPSCYGAPPSQNEPTKNEIKLRGVPRSVGTLKVIGYSCEVLGCRNVCKFHDDQSRPLCVRVLPDLPLLRLETSLKRCPTLSDNPNDAVAEVCVFSGQSFTHTITLQNSSKSIDIRDITIKIQQPQVAAGQKLLKILNVIAREREQDFKMLGIRAGTSRQMDFRIFGIDPATATPFESNANSTAPKGGGEPKAVTTTATGEQQRVYVRRPRSSTSLATITTESGGSGIGTGCALPRAESSDKNSGTLTNNSSSSQVQANSAASTKLLDSASTPLLVQEEEEEDGEGEGEEELDTGSNNRHHDLIPYTGRLLSCEFSFTYTADLSSKAEDFVRFAKFPLAITIVPAVNVASWHILAGDSTFTRYIVIDVFNQTDHEAELAYGQQRRTITVQPKEMCRVPLLCSCCRQIKSIAFQRATQRASHMMQMQEIEGLRRTVEKHVVKRLEIQWTISQLNLNGQVPVGSLLSSVSFLRQLVLPSLTIGIHVEEKSRVDGADINVHIGEIVAVEVSLYYSIGGTMSGHLSLCCHQDLQNGQPPVERPNNILVFGPNSMPFSIVGTKEEEKIRNNDSGGAEDEIVEEVEESDDDPRSPSTSEMEDQPHQQYKAVFSLVFCYEGVHKISPKVSGLQIRGAPDEFALGQKTTTLSDDDIFIPTLSFNVISKL